MMSRERTNQLGILGKLLAFIGGAILLIAGFMFSVVLLAVIAVAGLAAWCYVWWNTRKMRGVTREHPVDGYVIDGEAIVVDDSRSEERARLPDR